MSQMERNRSILRHFVDKARLDGIHPFIYRDTTGFSGDGLGLRNRIPVLDYGKICPERHGSFDVVIGLSFVPLFQNRNRIKFDRLFPGESVPGIPLIFMHTRDLSEAPVVSFRFEVDHIFYDFEFCTGPDPVVKSLNAPVSRPWDAYEDFMKGFFQFLGTGKVPIGLAAGVLSWFYDEWHPPSSDTRERSPDTRVGWQDEVKKIDAALISKVSSEPAFHSYLREKYKELFERVKALREKDQQWKTDISADMGDLGFN